MGKIRTKTIGDEGAEQEQKQKRKEQNLQKKARKGEGVSDEPKGPDEPKEPKEIKETKVPEETKEPKGEKKDGKASAKGRSSSGRKFAKAKKRSKAYLDKATAVDKKKTYSLKEGLEILPKIGLSRDKAGKATFDETVELHINTTETGVSATVTLPHGTGKQMRVAIASDDVIAQVEKGKIEFDILLAAPQMMPRLAKVAKVLGPKGLTPNPKNGTIGQNPEELAKQFAGGRMTIKTEAKSPLMHVTVGKVSFGSEKLTENIQMILKAIGSGKIKKVVLKSTMSPAIRITA